MGGQASLFHVHFYCLLSIVVPIVDFFSHIAGSYLFCSIFFPVGEG